MLVYITLFFGLVWFANQILFLKLSNSNARETSVTHTFLCSDCSGGYSEHQVRFRMFREEVKATSRQF